MPKLRLCSIQWTPFLNSRLTFASKILVLTESSVVKVSTKVNLISIGADF